MVWELDDEERNRILRSLILIGPKKAVGYLPLYTIEGLGLRSEDIQTECASKDLVAVELGSTVCCIQSGALYVYDRSALEKLLNSSSANLKANDWPTDPDAFVRAIAMTWMEADHTIMPLIRKAFADEPCQIGRD
jgi:hypothetical protein